MNAFIILIIFNFSYINNSPQASKEEILPDEESKPVDNFYLEFISEWERKMQDYNYEYLYYIPLNPREQEIFFENITTVPTLFKGGFFFADESNNQIEFLIKVSNDTIIHKAVGHHNLFELNLTKADRYSITFRNNIVKKKVVVTFTVNTGQNNLLESKDMTNTEKKMEALEALIKKFNMEFKLSRDIHTQRYKSK